MDISKNIVEEILDVFVPFICESFNNMHFFKNFFS